MTLPKIEEPTLYPSIVNHLLKIGFKAIGETIIKKDKPDILFQVDSVSFVIEVKIGKPEIGLNAVAQASDYAKKLGTQNIIILIYPEKYRNQTIFDADIINKIALEEQIHALVLTDYWTESLIIKPIELFESLKQRFLLKQIKIDFKTIVNLIESYVRDLNSVVYQIKTEELIAEVVNKLDLFSSLGEIKDKETAKKQVMNLASYLLFNQILFYQIYKKKSNTNNLSELEELQKIEDLQNYINQITKIDYQSIYKVNILGHIPNKDIVLNTLNDVIKAIKLLRAEHITHDLAGRFFHDLIPFEVRKVLAAFYTHPIAADLLAGLVIDSWDKSVIDPACGSGTLLVAAYRRKQELYHQIYGFQNINKMHKKFIEEDLTGIDIMPFAAHMTTINLTTQNIEYETNKVRIANKDSLDIASSLKTKEFKEKGYKIPSYTETIQQTLIGISGQKVVREGALSPNGKSEEFFVNPVDVVIMNPPFTDREKMPLYMRQKLKSNLLGNICGHQVNLWGYFLALADLYLRPNGKIGAVIPINIARGKATEKIRNFLLENYHIEYIVKPIADIAFSEGAAFRDVLFVAEKRKPNEKDITKILFLKKSIREIKQDLIEKILSFNEEFVEVRDITFNELKKHKANLMPLLMSKELFNLSNLLTKSNRLVSFDTSNIDIGLPYRPEGVADGVFITNPIDESRTKAIKTILALDKKDHIYVKLKFVPKDRFFYKIKKDSLGFALRTLTGIKKLAISEKETDYILIKKQEKYWDLLRLYGLKIPKPFPWQNHFKLNLINNKTHILLPDKINLVSPNTYFISIFSKLPLISVGSTLWFIKNIAKENAKCITLYFNSIISLVQFLILKSETLGSYTRLMKNDWNQFKILDIDKITNVEKDMLLNVFEKLKDIEFPSLLEQIENRFWARIELDKTILKILGFSDREISDLLPKIYDSILAELKALKDIK